MSTLWMYYFLDETYTSPDDMAKINVFVEKHIPMLKFIV